VAHDAYFCWTHRLMHHRRLFRTFHLAHHRSRLPTPFAAYAFAPAEAVVQALFLPLFLLAVPMCGWAIFAFLLHMIVRNVIGHSGHEWSPRGTATSRWFGWLTTVTHHDLHHENERGNYGLYFSWWDRLMGTEHPDYRRRFALATAAQSAPAARSASTSALPMPSHSPSTSSVCSPSSGAALR
jgi:sterol desaturase/sphingolipid hydroxylase (fatty acid hydroxylase superfamily)